MACTGFIAAIGLTMSDPVRVFDPAAVRAHRNRASRLDPGGRFLRDEVMNRLIERLLVVRRSFDHVLDLYAADGGLAARLAAIGSKARVTAFESGEGFACLLDRAGEPVVVGDGEALPFAPGSFDLVVSALGLHWVNDLPGALVQVRQALKPDGLLLAALFGGETLRELRAVLIAAELAVTGGAAPRVSPFLHVRDGGSLLQRAGFALPVADSDLITLTFPNLFALLHELRALGETNALADRLRRGLRRDVLIEAARLYAARYGDAGGRIPASFEIVTLTGWSPHASQPKALKPGSATVHLGDVLGGGSRSLP